MSTWAANGGKMYSIDMVGEPAASSNPNVSFPNPHTVSNLNFQWYSFKLHKFNNFLKTTEVEDDKNF